jgi:predicted metal-dependent phosphoesterase TrpH
MPKFDHHLHTSRYSPDSAIDPDELLQCARAAGLDGVVITDHDFQWPDDELADLAARANGLRVFSGAEISAREGHFLVYGLPDLDEAPPGISLRELLEVVEGHGAAIVAAHPFRWDQPFESYIHAHGPVFDALELVSNNVTPETRGKTAAILERYPNMAATGSSDGHDTDVIGCYFSALGGQIETLADFVAALKRGDVRPGHRPGARQASGPIG